ncbi:hypothetical protein ElyMa_001969100 [Elysia marginata]|uniref:Uncharacterized protein n=1 Tax=Elysia marginata TaxID=1093978 RepID=A0AAV4EZ26_9GAST|nr:hypothetical protein ElyMa_001969100 [Elysia marginata]
MSPTRLSHDGSHESPGRDGSPAKYTDVSGGSSGNHGYHRFVLTKPRGRAPNRKQAKPKSKRVHNVGDIEVSNKMEFEKRGSRDTLRDTGSQNTPSLGSEREEANRGDSVEEERGARRRPAWNSNVKVDGHFQPTVNLRKYENELTFKPSITTKEEVYHAYTGYDNLGSVEGADGPDEDRYSPLSFDGDNSDRSRSNSGSPGRSKERILSKREARAYIKMTGVYGSDAFKNQRKQWFMDKLASAQDKKAKLEEERRKAEERKRDEDRKKQQRQLNYVREKFRKEQVHRFRTQYVTSRVLEHEQANRHEYGLPEEYDDGSSATKDNPNSLNPKEDQHEQDVQNGEANSTNLNTHPGQDTLKHKDNPSKVVQKMNEYQQRKNKENRRKFNDTFKNNQSNIPGKGRQQIQNGHVVKQKKQVKSVVKEAEKLLKVPVDDAIGKRPISKKSQRLASPDVTLGSDFDIDDDEDETVGDIFERLRKKYNIQIDSDEEDEV